MGNIHKDNYIEMENKLVDICQDMLDTYDMSLDDIFGILEERIDESQEEDKD